jgi:hypothetical protein
MNDILPKLFTKDGLLEMLEVPTSQPLSLARLINPSETSRAPYGDQADGDVHDPAPAFRSSVQRHGVPEWVQWRRCVLVRQPAELRSQQRWRH